MVPRATDQNVVTRVKLLRAEAKAPNGLSGFVDRRELDAVLVTKKNFSVVEGDCEDLTIRRPVTVEALYLGDELVDILAFCLPEAKVVVGARSKTLQHWVEAKSLNWRIMRILEQTDSFSRPNNDVAVGTAGGPTLAIL